MLKATPGAAREKDSKGRLPLHLAAERGAKVVMVRELLAAHPQAAKVKDGEGKLPLHRRC